MPEVPPELAEKVGAADLRNHVKQVGEGATLSPANRQMFMAFAAAGDPEAALRARQHALLSKWLQGGRLSKEEREEIEHILPGPKAVEAPGPAPDTAAAATAAAAPRTADGYGHLNISRRTYFRWRKIGESCADGPDLPPFDEPGELPAWYERMRQRGVFKHRFPTDIADAIAGLGGEARAAPTQTSTTAGPGAAPTPAASQATTSTVAPPAGGSVPASFTADHGQASGLQYEVAAGERRVASLRVARDSAYLNNERSQGDMLDRQYREALDALSLVQQRAMKILEQDGRLVPVDLIEREMGPRLTAIAQSGLLLWERIDQAMMNETDKAARRRIWRKAWIEHLQVLVDSKYAPPMRLEDLAA
jgi:hypothetical protein